MGLNRRKCDVVVRQTGIQVATKFTESQKCYYYRLQTKLREGNVFTSMHQSPHPQGLGVCIPTCTWAWGVYLSNYLGKWCGRRGEGNNSSWSLFLSQTSVNSSSQYLAPVPFPVLVIITFVSCSVN